jgi:tellurite resistance protein TerA
MSMQKGANTAVPAQSVRVVLSWRSGAGIPDADGSALLLVNGKVRNDSDFVFYNQPNHPGGAVRYEGKNNSGGTVTDTLWVNLAGMDGPVERVLLAASADGGTFGRVPGLSIQVLDAANNAEVARFDAPGATSETAFILGELYKRNGAWKFRAVGQGYDSGLSGLARDFGISVDDDPAPQPPPQQYQAPQAPPAAPQPPPAQAGPPVRLSKITLTKQSPSVSLTKSGGSRGALKVNLNWSVRGQAPRKGLFGRRQSALPDLDLDLCALWELQDGDAGIVHPINNRFGSFNGPPYVLLDRDDRSGAAAEGENLTINLDHASKIKRILIFANIYDGADSFTGLDAVATLFPLQGPPIEMHLDECTVTATAAAVALIENVNGEMVVRREARYIVRVPGKSNQQLMDEAYGWGLQWVSAPPKQ